MAAGKRRRLAEQRRPAMSRSWSSSVGRPAGRKRSVGSVGCTARRSWIRTVAGTERTGRCRTEARSGRRRCCSAAVAAVSRRQTDTAGTALATGWEQSTATGTAERSRTAAAVVAGRGTERRRRRSCRRPACKTECTGPEEQPGRPVGCHSSASTASCSCRSTEPQAVAVRHTMSGTETGTEACMPLEQRWWPQAGTAAGCRTADKLVGRLERIGCC